MKYMQKMLESLKRYIAKLKQDTLNLFDISLEKNESLTTKNK